jgi:hypothetical protein
MNRFIHSLIPQFIDWSITSLICWFMTMDEEEEEEEEEEYQRW